MATTLSSILSLSLFVALVHGAAQVVVLKEIDADPASVGLNKDLQVTFTIFNTGDEAAHQVRVMDAYWPDSFADVVGFRDFSFDEVAPNTNVTHTFIVSPTETGVFNIPAARVGYQESRDATVTKSISSFVGYVRVVDSGSSDSTESHTVEWIVFSVLSAASVLAPFSVLKMTRKNFPEGI